MGKGKAKKQHAKKTQENEAARKEEEDKKAEEKLKRRICRSRKDREKKRLGNAAALVVSKGLVDQTVVDDLCRSIDELENLCIRIESATENEAAKILKDELLKAKKVRLCSLCELAVTMGLLNRTDVDDLCVSLNTRELEILCNKIQHLNDSETAETVEQAVEISKVKEEEHKTAAEVASQLTRTSVNDQTMPSDDPTPPSDLVPISSGSTGTNYEILRERVITDPQTSTSVSYYEGYIIFQGEHLKKEKRDACFFACNNFDLAKTIYDSSNRISHDRVMRASSIFYDDVVSKYLVGFSKFVDLEIAKKEDKVAERLVVCSTVDDYPVPGNPSTFVMEEIKGLVRGYEYMLQNNVSSSFLNMAYCYVWCPITAHVRILLVDTVFVGSVGSANPVIELHFNQLAEGLCERFLRNPPCWPEREQFLSCFSRRTVLQYSRMRMIDTHPFLEDSVKHILGFFPWIWNEVKSGSTTFVSAINDAGFIAQFCDQNKSWKKDDWCETFQLVFVYDNVRFVEGDAQNMTETETVTRPAYDTTNMKHHVRFLRNVYEHLDKYGMSMLAFFEEVRRCWPNLIQEYHVKSYESVDPGE